jgi:hypothetical protein
VIIPSRDPAPIINESRGRLQVYLEIDREDIGLGTLNMTTSTTARPGRNQPCHCGSGRKYKQCCLEKDEAKAAAARSETAEETPAASPEAGTSPPKRAPKHRTDQPWKSNASQGFVPRTRLPRKVGGS